MTKAEETIERILALIYANHYMREYYPYSNLN